MAQREYEVSFKVKSNKTWSHITNNINGRPVVYRELNGTDGVWYRIPEDAEIKDISPLQEGYYLIKGNGNVYRYLTAAPHDLVEYYTGERWVESDAYSSEDVEEWRHLATYLGPLDPDDETL